MNKNKIASDYAQATKSQAQATDNINQALQAICQDNCIFSLAEPVEQAYTRLVTELLGQELFDWLMWWIYETDYGTKSMMYSVNNHDYDPKSQTLEEFWNIIDA